MRKKTDQGAAPPSKKGGWSDDAGPLNNPFAALGGGKPVVAGTPEPSAPAPAKSGPEKVPKRAVVRLERKGRGGKTVLVVSHLGLDATALEVWAKLLRKQLGCGGQVEDDTIILQGNDRERVAQVLRRCGVGQVTVG